MSSTPKLISVIGRDTCEIHPVTGGVGIVQFSFDQPAGGKVIALSLDDPEGQAFFATDGGKTLKTKTVPNPKDKMGGGEIGVNAVFRVPVSKVKRNITVKGTCGGVTVSKIVSVSP